MTGEPRVLGFDVFGTLVDWRTAVVRESAGFLRSIGRDDDPAAFTDGWRMQYLGAMRDHAGSGRGFVPLDVLHREMLEAALRGIGVEPEGLDPALLAEWTFAWHRLDPWPDVVEGMARLKRRFPLVALSNGNVALVMALARRGGLPFDAVLGAEVTRAYKPDREAYLGTARVLGVAPGELCLVAAHHSDLAAGRRCGLGTAFVARPMEYGGRTAPDAGTAQAWDWEVETLIGLAERLGC